MTARPPPHDLAARYRALTHNLDEIRQTSDVALARAGAAIDVIIDFFPPRDRDLLEPLYDVLGEKVEQRTTEAESTRKAGGGGRPPVGVWETMERAVILAGVDLLSKHGHPKIDAQRRVVKELRRLRRAALPDEKKLGQWDHDWAPKQARPSELAAGRLPPDLIRSEALTKMDAMVADGDEPLSVVRRTLERYISGQDS